MKFDFLNEKYSTDTDLKNFLETFCKETLKMVERHGLHIHLQLFLVVGIIATPSKDPYVLRCISNLDDEINFSGFISSLPPLPDIENSKKSNFYGITINDITDKTTWENLNEIAPKNKKSRDTINYLKRNSDKLNQKYELIIISSLNTRIPSQHKFDWTFTHNNIVLAGTIGQFDIGKSE